MMKDDKTPDSNIEAMLYDEEESKSSEEFSDVNETPIDVTEDVSEPIDNTHLIKEVDRIMREVENDNVTLRTIKALEYIIETVKYDMGDSE